MIPLCFPLKKRLIPCHRKYSQLGVTQRRYYTHFPIVRFMESFATILIAFSRLDARVYTNYPENTCHPRDFP